MSLNELLKDYAFALRRLEYDADKPGSNMTLGEYEAEEKKVTDEYSQAIAATFGSGKLTAEQVEEAVYRNCKFYEGGEVDVESITDELNAELGGGECRVVASATDGVMLSKSWKWFELSCGHTFKLYGFDAPVACPVCGKAVER